MASCAEQERDDRNVSEATAGKVNLFTLGTPHGLDQLAWVVGGHIASKQLPWVEVHTARDPLRLTVLPSREHPLAVLDTTLTPLSDSPLWRFRWPDLPVDSERPLSSHGLDLKYALELLASLGQLPSLVLVYAISVAGFPGDEKLAKTFVSQLAESLLADLRLATGNTRQVQSGPVPVHLPGHL